jgi:hypothetical protein
MDPKIIPFRNYLIEIHEHPIYHDFEFVIKDNTGKVTGASMQQFSLADDAEISAKMKINEILWR